MGWNARVRLYDERSTVANTTPTVVIATPDVCAGLILEQTLRPRGFKTRRIRDADELRRVLEADPVDVVLLDVDLGSDGVAQMVDLIRSGHTPRCGWVALVEADDTETRNRALTAGAARCCVKPTYPAEIRATVRRLLAVSRSR